MFSPLLAMSSSRLMHNSGVLRSPLPQTQNMLLAAIVQAQSHNNQVPLEFYAVDEYRNKVKPAKVPFHELPHLFCRSLHKMPAYAGFLYAVTLDEALNRLRIIAARDAKNHILHYRVPHAPWISESLIRGKRNFFVVLAS